MINDHPICHISGCKCGWCSRRGLRPQPNRDLSLRHQAGKHSRTGLLLKFSDKSYQLLLILQGASPKPGPWVHHRAQGGDIWTRQNAFLGNYDTDIDRGATSSASFVLEEVASLFIIHLKVCQLKFTPPVQVQKPLLTKWCLDATPSVSWFLSPFVLMFFYRTQVRL